MSASSQLLSPSTPQPQNAFGGCYRGKRVLLTGHTGFKGAWLAEWLLSLGAEVTGFALPPPTTPSLFGQLGLASRLRHIEGDVRDLASVRAAFSAARPDFVFHLAAQPLVRLSYDQPTETFAANVMGTANVLEALRCYQNELNGKAVESLKGSVASTSQQLNSSASNGVIAAVMVTTDKCYENREWVHSYREEDPMGGYDPYSASKGAAELVIASYRRSFFNPSTPQLLNSSTTSVRLASARAGNVIGGGDWALDRIVPDCIRALAKGDSIPVRNKVATRPWQHVLEPLSGYLWLGAALAAAGSAAPRFEGETVEGLNGSSSGTVQQLNSQTLQPGGSLASRFNFPAAVYQSAFNFGPSLASNRTVAGLVQEILKHWPGRWEDKSDPKAPHEAKLLNLATDKAHHFLGWSPAWPFEETIARTVAWYRQASGAAAPAAGSEGSTVEKLKGSDAANPSSLQHLNHSTIGAAHGADIHALTSAQITAYTEDARAAGLAWAAKSATV